MKDEVERTPNVRLLLGASLALFLLPLALQALGVGPGSYSMFTQPVRYQVRMLLTLEDGSRRYLPMERVMPHLGRDARRVVGHAARWFVGESQVTLLASAVDDLGELACRLEPRAKRAAVLLERTTVSYEPLPRTQATVDCDQVRR